MLYPTHFPRNPEQQTADEVARQYHREQMAASQTAQRQAHYRANPDYDPKLLKPVAIQPAPPMSDAERQLLESELGCLRREEVEVRRGIDFLLKKLAA